MSDLIEFILLMDIFEMMYDRLEYKPDNQIHYLKDLILDLYDYVEDNTYYSTLNALIIRDIQDELLPKYWQILWNWKKFIKNVGKNKLISNDELRRMARTVMNDEFIASVDSFLNTP